MREHARARSGLATWLEAARSARWKSFGDVREHFRTADQIRVASGRQVVIFNIAGNSYRLICALHYVSGLLFAMRFLTHAEYTKEKWKEKL
jgi:mRNA interferase HigB